MKAAIKQEEVINEAKAILKKMFSNDPAIYQRSPMDFFSGRTQKQSSIVLKRCSQKMSRQHVATATRCSQASPLLPIDDNYSDAHLFAHLASLDSVHITFIRAIYMKPGRDQFDHQLRASAILRDRYLSAINKKLRIKTQNVIGKMAEVYLECMCTPSFAVAMTVEPWKQFGIDNKAWYKSYSKHWKAVKALARSLYDDALMGFYA